MDKIFKKRRRDSHKGDYGHILLVGGSIGLTGAIYLSGEAAILTGSGLVTCAIPKSLNSLLAKKFIEVMTLPIEDRKRGYLALSAFPKIAAFFKKVDAVAIGPGLSKNRGTKNLVHKLLISLNIPIVLDADGINCIAGQPQILKKTKNGIVITPHAAELSRLIGKSIKYIQKNRSSVTVETAKKYGAITVLKGADTVVASPLGKRYINKTGNPGMATGGAGDVLTGIISSLIGQGFDCYNASKYGVYLHGLAGDIASRKTGEASLRARDILQYIPDAIRETEKNI